MEVVTIDIKKCILSEDLAPNRLEWRKNSCSRPEHSWEKANDDDDGLFCILTNYGSRFVIKKPHHKGLVVKPHCG